MGNISGNKKEHNPIINQLMSHFNWPTEESGPEISREFVYRYIDELKKIVTGYYPQGQPFTLLKKMLNEAGVRVKSPRKS